MGRQGRAHGARGAPGKGTRGGAGVLVFVFFLINDGKDLKTFAMALPAKTIIS